MAKIPPKPPMRLMLLRDVPGLGALGEVVRVKPGYARNYLVPRGFATTSSNDSTKRVAAIRKRAALEAQKSLENAKAAAVALIGVSIHIEQKAGEGGHLYGSVTAAMISEEMAKQGYKVDASGVLLEQPIKELGIYEVPLKLHGDVEAKVKLYVVTPPPEKHEKKAAAEKAEKSERKAASEKAEKAEKKAK